MSKHKIKILEENVTLAWKPKGVFSFGFIKQLQRQNNWKKVGHAGTLDPLAEGLMIVGFNKGTKKLGGFVGLDKVYQTTILLGLRTASGDLGEEVLEEVEIEELPVVDKIEEVLAGLVGEVELEVPIFSAVKKGGETLYKKARRGEKVVAPRRVMEIKGLELTAPPRLLERKGFLDVRMHVGSGVYVRSVAEEIGRRLGWPATVASLMRVQIGDFCIDI